MSGGLDATKPSRFSRRFKRDEIRAGWWGAQNGRTPCNPFIYPGGVSGWSERRGLCNAIADHDLSAKRMGGRPAGTITWRRASFRTLSPPLDVTYARKARRHGGWRRARLAARSKLSKEPDRHCVAKPWRAADESKAIGVKSQPPWLLTFKTQVLTGKYIALR